MDPALHKAAIEGKVELLRRTVGEKSTSVLLPVPPHNNSVLHIASRFGHEEFAGEVLRLCPSLLSATDSRLDTPLHVAARSGKASIVRLLISQMKNTAGDIEEDTSFGLSKGWRMTNQSENMALHEALKRGYEEVGLQLLDLQEEQAMVVNGAGESPLYLAANGGLRKLVVKIMKCSSFSLEGPKGRNPLHAAVINGHLGITEMFLHELPHLVKQADTLGKTVLHYAATEKMMHLLLSSEPSSASIADEQGLSPLLVAAIEGNIRLLEIILSYSSDSCYLLNTQGQNALHLSVINNKQEMLKYLIERQEFESLINEMDNEGNTCLHFATMNCNSDIVELFLECQGVDVNITNKDGLTCLDTLTFQPGIRFYFHRSTIEDRLRSKGATHSMGSMNTSSYQSDANRDFVFNTLSVVATLLVTITFAAGFTIPGGFKNDGPKEGIAVLLRKKAFQAFVISDSIAMFTYLAAVFLFIAGASADTDTDMILHLLSYSLMGTIVAFITGVYVVTSEEALWVAILVCVSGGITCYFMLFSSTINSYMLLFGTFAQRRRRQLVNVSGITT